MTRYPFIHHMVKTGMTAQGSFPVPFALVGAWTAGLLLVLFLGRLVILGRSFELFTFFLVACNGLLTGIQISAAWTPQDQPCLATLQIPFNRSDAKFGVARSKEQTVRFSVVFQQPVASGSASNDCNQDDSEIYTAMEEFFNALI